MTMTYYDNDLCSLVYSSDYATVLKLATAVLKLATATPSFPPLFYSIVHRPLQVHHPIDCDWYAKADEFPGNPDVYGYMSWFVCPPSLGGSMSCINIISIIVLGFVSESGELRAPLKTVLDRAYNTICLQTSPPFVSWTSFPVHCPRSVDCAGKTPNMRRGSSGLARYPAQLPPPRIHVKP